MFNLAGKRALVTGATGGIGEAIAASLKAAGATVTVSGTNPDKLSALAANYKTIACNLSDSAAVQELPKKAEEAMGGLDILINNAGITRDNIFMRMKDEEWEDVLKVNLSANFLLTRASIRGMMKQRFGRIINITSIVGVMGNAGQANYAASKAGLIGMTKSVAAEVASRGITANCIAPGFITTPMTDKLNEDQKNKMLGAIPAGAFGVPSDIASACVFLSSNEAGYITGQTLHINGGMLMV
jgi:3-oxoacyl-[acyl-carrier protein] reductase